MATNEQFKRYVEAGAAFLEMTQQRAEAIVKDLVGSGEVARGQAQKAAEWLVERSQKTTEELMEVVRREVRLQMQALGVATTDDIAQAEARLEARLQAGLEAMAPSASTSPPPKKRATARPPTKKPSAPSAKAAPITKAATARKRTPAKAPKAAKAAKAAKAPKASKG